MSGCRVSLTPIVSLSGGVAYYWGVPVVIILSRRSGISVVRFEPGASFHLFGKLERVSTGSF